MEVKVVHNSVVADGLEALIKSGEKVGKVGWTSEAVYEGMFSTKTVAQVALENEFGTVKKDISGGKMVRIPARPFLRNTIRRESHNWLHAMTEGAKAVLNNASSFEEVLDKTGKQAIDDIHNTVRNRVAPPLAPLTLELRAVKRKSKEKLLPTGDLPLYDTGHMMQTLDNEVTTE